MPRASTRQRQACLPHGQAGIQSFARTTKSNVAAATTTTTTSPLKTGLPVSPSKKRKLSELENVESGPGRIEGENGTEGGKGPTLTPSKSLRFAELSVSSPRSGHYASSSSSSAGVKGSLARRGRAKSDIGIFRAVGSGSTTPRNTRPKEFHDLVNLHSSFLKALTLHAAHNGVSTPADLRDFLRSVERLWKKRKVVVKDLQRLVWIWDQGAQVKNTGYSYRLANYGLGKVCLERITGEEWIDENRLQAMFERELELLWEEANLDDSQGEEFIETLGVSPVHESLTPFTSFRKGQQRLQDLKGGIIRLKTEKLRAEPDDENAPKQTESASSRRQGLWDRIRNKQLRQSKLPPPPTKDMLLRRAAAERVEEVASVLACLKPGYVANGHKATIAAHRKPFQLDMIVQYVQDSSRNPISPREVEICVELMAMPNVAGQWVNIVTVNQLKSVVLKSCANVSLKEIGARVGEIKAGWEDAKWDLVTE